MRKKLKFKTLKTQKGITLIALVITIIVLLILAGVSIAMLTGENGILTQANKAALETRGASVEEAKDIWEANKAMDDSTSNPTAQSLEELVADLEEQGLLIDDEPEQVLTTGQVTIGSRTIVFGSTAPTLVEMFEQAQADGCTNEDGSCQREDHLHIGDYVNYKPVTTSENSIASRSGGNSDLTYTSSGEQTGMNYVSGAPDEVKNQVFNATNSTTWRVLGIEGSGSNIHILLISGSPIKKETTRNDPYYYLYGARGYQNMETELDNICAIYGHGNGATGARSVTTEDINNVCGVTVDSSGVKPDGVDQGGNFGQTYSYTNQYASAEDYLSGTRTNFSKTSDAYYYNGDDSLLTTATNTRLYDMLFYPRNQQDYKTNWLASRCVNVYSDVCIFNAGAVCDGAAGPGGWGLFGSNGVVGYRYCGVRPVVSLESDVTVDTIQKIPDQQEEDWSQYQGASGEVS